MSFHMHQAYPNDDAYGAVMNSAVLLLTAGSDSHVVGAARRMLTVRSMEELLIMGDNCGVKLRHLFSRNIITMEEARRYFDA